MKSIKIYVANLAKYNNGILEGQWLELPMCEYELSDILDGMGDYAIHDYEADFQINEYSDIHKLNKFLQ